MRQVLGIGTLTVIMALVTVVPLVWFFAQMMPTGAPWWATLVTILVIYGVMPGVGVIVWARLRRRVSLEDIGYGLMAFFAVIGVLAILSKLGIPIGHDFP